jgi:hypothetical protein
VICLFFFSLCVCYNTQTTHRFFKNVRWTSAHFTFSEEAGLQEQQRALARQPSFRMTRPLYSSFTADHIFREEARPVRSGAPPEKLLHPARLQDMNTFVLRFQRDRGRAVDTSSAPRSARLPIRPRPPQASILASSQRHAPRSARPQRPRTSPSPSSSSSSAARTQVSSRCRVIPPGFPIRSYKCHSAPPRTRTSRASRTPRKIKSTTLRHTRPQSGVDFGKTYLS